VQIVRTPGSARAIARTLARPVGLVPTMGALHAGHISLVERARAENASVVASIFVNPLQFGPNEDYAKYPRSFEHDVEMLAQAGVDLLYAPAVERMYPPNFAASIDVGAVATSFEGARRPGHFAGVATVVAKLLHAIEPTSLYLGQKDVQQTAVLRAMLRDLDMATNAVVVPTLRDVDGLALSSRNVYLSAAERAAAPSLFRALTAAAEAVEKGETDSARVLASARELLEEPLVWDYLAVIDPETFVECDPLRRSTVAIGVARAGSVRLLDNVTIPSAVGVDPILTPPHGLPRAARIRST
jgi:pantoate--beta-alanine ligase